MPPEAGEGATQIQSDAPPNVNEGAPAGGNLPPADNPPVDKEVAAAPANPPGDVIPADTDDGAAPPATPAPDAPAAPVIPEAYSLALPEDTVLTADSLTSVEARSKERGYTQEQAEQNLSDVNDAVNQYQVGMDTAWEAEKDGWRAELKADVEFAGEKGELYDANLVKVQEMIERFGNDELKEKLVDTGIGDYVPLVKAWLNVANAAAEGELHDAVLVGQSDKSAAEYFYDNS